MYRYMTEKMQNASAVQCVIVGNMAPKRNEISLFGR